MLSLFLSRHLDQPQLSALLKAEVREDNRDTKYLSGMAARLRNSVMRDTDHSEFATPLEANLRLIESGVGILQCDPEVQEADIPIEWMRLEARVQPAVPFVAATARVRVSSQ